MRHRENGLERENGARGMMTAFVAGSVAGGITALLFAPTSGRRFRRSLARGGRRFRRRAMDSVATAQEHGQSALEQASESLHEIAHDARHLARSWSNR
jgi:gas vesicle protein